MHAQLKRKVADMPDESSKHPRTEFHQGRTFGECVCDEIASITMVNGEFKATLHIKDKPKRLNRDDALKYYTKKLQHTWERIGYTL